MEHSCLQIDPLLTTTATVFNLFNNFQPILITRSFKSIDGSNGNACPVPNDYYTAVMLFEISACKYCATTSKTIKVWIRKQKPIPKPSQLSQRETHMKNFSLLPARNTYINIIC